MLLISRLLEGLGATILVVLAPAAIAMWFSREKVGTAMGIWTTAGPVAAIIALMVAPLLAPVIGWRGVWWVTAAISVALMVVYWLLVRSPPRLAAADLPDKDGNLPVAALAWRKALDNRDIWLLGLAFLIFTLVVMPFLTYYVTFLASFHGYTVARAGLIFSLAALATIPSALLSGWLSDFLGTRKWMAIIAFIILGPLFVMLFQVSGWMIIVFAVLLNIVGISIPVSLLAAVPDTMHDVRLVGLGMSVTLIGQNLGLIIGPPLFGGLVERTSWEVATFVFAPLCLLGALVILLTRKMP
jgi:predicted MFS family arabinose efflux permease